MIVIQFVRTDKVSVQPRQHTMAELREMTPEQREGLGMQRWNRNIWLFPSEWFSQIPEGTEVVDIFYNDRIFAAAEFDNDTRFGALSFGIRVGKAA